jgi:HSP20 family protein
MSTTLPARISEKLGLFRRRDPFQVLQQEMDDLITRFSDDWGGDWLARPFAPLADVSETGDALQVRMDVPGIPGKDIEIEVTGNTLRVKGDRKEEHEEKGKTWHRLERRHGSFERSVTLPCAVREDKVEASCEEGVLTIRLPKTETAKTHKIAVKGNGNGKK